MAQIVIPFDLKALSLSACVLLTTYTTWLAGRPPNPTPYDSKNPDILKAAVTPSAIFVRGFINVSLGISHALLCLAYPSPPQLFCPHPSHLAPYLFTWNPYSAFCIATILLGCSIRLSAFSALGTNFTFRLAPPKTLVTSGLYKYVQHPSYTGKLLALSATLALVERRDGPLGCWLPAFVMQLNLLWRILSCLFVLLVARTTWKRVKEEEAMMKETFGKEWVDWHAKTKRFIPGVF